MENHASTTSFYVSLSDILNLFLGSLLFGVDVVDSDEVVRETSIELGSIGTPSETSASMSVTALSDYNLSKNI